MIVNGFFLAAALLSSAGAESQASGQPAPAVATVVGIAPDETQRKEALDFQDHPFVLGTWKILEAHRPLMRCLQLASGTRTEADTGKVTPFARLSNRCSFPLRFIGEVGKKDAAGNVCLAELHVKSTMPAFQEFDLPDFVTSANCFRDIAELGVVAEG